MLEGDRESLGVYLHLTRECNLRCRYCYSGEKKPYRMSLGVGQKTVDFFLDRTDHLTLRFFGGEPLLEFELLKSIVGYSEAEASKRKKDVRYVVVTNGTLFTAEVSEFCRRHRIDFSLSFDGNQQAQDANRVFASGKGSFAAVERNIPHMLRASSYPPVVAVVHPDNVAVLPDSIRYLVEKGFRIISLSPDYTDARLREYLPAIKRKYYELAEIYLEYRRRGDRIFLNAFDPVDSPFSRARCKLGQEDFSVGPFGDIYPCCCFVDQEAYLLGNIYEGIDPAKAEVFLQDLRRLEQHMEEAHRDCPENSFCKKGCGCTNLVSSRKLGVIDSVLCEYGRMEAEVRDYVSARITS